MRIRLYKMGRGFVPVGEDAEKVHDKMSPGEIAWFKPIRVRDPVKHGRYWGLMTLCGANCERIELPYSSVMIVHSKDDVHTAIKLCTGLCDTIFDAFGKPAFQIPKSTNFESMDADEWDQYWPQVLDVVEERILPGVRTPEVQVEIQKCMGWAR